MSQDEGRCIAAVGMDGTYLSQGHLLRYIKLHGPRPFLFRQWRRNTCGAGGGERERLPSPTASDRERKEREPRDGGGERTEERGKEVRKKGRVEGKETKRKVKNRNSKVGTDWSFSTWVKSFKAFLM